MELELDDVSIVVKGPSEITLPIYMTMLQQEELDNAISAPQREQMIVAAGCDSFGDIVVLTATMQLMILKTKENNIPTGRAFPIDHGHGIEIECDRNYEMASDWVIENAKPLGIELT